MGRKQELAKNTAVLTIGKLMTKLISFFLLPLYTTILAAEEYGAYDVLVTYGTLLIPIFNWQFDQGLFRFMLDNRKDEGKQKELFSTMFFSCFLQIAVYVILFLLVMPLLKMEDAYFLLLYVVLHILFQLLHQFIRGRGGNVKYTIASFISSSMITIMNVITLVFLKMGLQGMYISTLVALVMSIIYMVFATKFWKFFSFRCIRMDTFRQVAAYAFPLIPNNLAWWVVNASNRLVIKRFLGLTANGIFTAANKFPNVFIQFYNILNLSWTETVTLHFEDEDRDEFLTETMTALFKLFSCACFGIMALMPFIYSLLVRGAEYAPGFYQIPILMLGMLFRVLVGLYSCIYVAQKNAKKIATTSAMAAAINLTVSLGFIKSLGLYAASLSTLVAFLAMFIIRYIDVNRTVHMKIQKNIAIPTIVVAILSVVSYYSGLKIVQVIVLGIVIVYSVMMNMDYVKMFTEKVKKILKRA